GPLQRIQAAFHGRLAITERLGSGTYGIVYGGTLMDERTGAVRSVAVKAPRPNGADASGGLPQSVVRELAMSAPSGVQACPYIMTPIEKKFIPGMYGGCVAVMERAEQ
ncbi:unnamed protein product, partial [Symbiodinium sp. KB8]